MKQQILNDSSNSVASNVKIKNGGRYHLRCNVAPTGTGFLAFDGSRVILSDNAAVWQANTDGSDRNGHYILQFEKTFKYLDGNIGDKGIYLAEDILLPGTHWLVDTNKEGNLNLRVLAGDWPYLDGRIDENTVSLAPGTSWPYTGTVWAITEA